ncbi:PREDICTED: ras guanine nucleotide exchange factor Y [Drosophila arizonae]|uniref:Ras guanine nucleotide exchange factor Y n=1 Tax=Drosophila arizonae TaxID=7263 RepID=A0ABM1NRZ8_DROAR|nr:PREDICTED: ras guanine nucleotide exchange factor Y [Drosophila arizonae]
MKPVIEWLISVCAGLLFSTQSMRILKIANDEKNSPSSSSSQTKSVTAIQDELEKPYIMGSEQISAALQTVLSSDGNNLDNQSLSDNNNNNNNNNGQFEYTLGSESLNRMLEDMLARPCSENLELPHIEPAIQL